MTIHKDHARLTIPLFLKRSVVKAKRHLLKGPLARLAAVRSQWRWPECLHYRLYYELTSNCLLKRHLLPASRCQARNSLASDAPGSRAAQCLCEAAQPLRPPLVPMLDPNGRRWASSEVAPVVSRARTVWNIYREGLYFTASG